MTDIATIEPNEITAGDTVKWRKQLADYPASDGWVLSYALVIGTAAKVSITATADGDEHLVTLSAVTTAAYAAGIYQWQSYVTKAGERFSIETGSITVKPNYASGALNSFDARSHVKKVLDAVEALLEGTASKDQQEYTIAGRSLTRRSIPELIKLRQQYLAYYKQEQDAQALRQGKPKKNRILVRF